MIVSAAPYWNYQHILVSIKCVTVKPQLVCSSTCHSLSCSSTSHRTFLARSQSLEPDRPSLAGSAFKYSTLILLRMHVTTQEHC